MIERTTKRKPKKDVCHFAIVLEVLFQKWFPLEGAKSQEGKKQRKQPQEHKRRKDCLRERFIKNKRPINPMHISPKKEKQPKTRTNRRAIMMFESNDDEERKTLQKRILQ
jgi:hypothetical protein